MTRSFRPAARSLARAVLVITGATLIAGLWASSLARAKDTQAAVSSKEDRAAIEKVLAHYRVAVSTGDEALFLSTILDEQIPFFSVGSTASQDASLRSEGTRDLAGFRRAVFHSGKQYRQTFDHVRIQQDASMAQVWLHFITRVQGSDSGGEGWKTLALLKVGGDWKIASEFYTARAFTDNI